MSSQADAQWTEPPWSGWIETTGDALLILEAARRGLIPRVTRRLVDGERKMITSGSVFVFDEKESGIKRWTDGFFWSPSRILGNFLLYRETDKRGSGHRGRGEGDDSPPGQPEYLASTSTSLSRSRTDGNMLGIDKMRERSLMGSLTNSYKFKSDGLMKKTFSLHIDGAAQHLISYYRIEDVESGRLRSPSSLPELASLSISPELLDKTHFRNPPKVEIGPDGIPRYRGEADDIDPSPTILTAPLSTGLPLLTDGHYTTDKRSAKRFDPYGPPPNNKRRRAKSDDPSSSASGSTETTKTPQAQPLLQAPQPYTDSNHQMIQSSQPQSQSQSPVPHQPTLHPPPHHHPYATPYAIPSNMPMGYYPYPGHAMYTSPYPPGTTGSPIPTVPPSTQPTPSPPVPSSTSTTPTPATTGGMSSSTSGSASAGNQPPPVAPTPYSYPHPFHHHQAAVSTTGAADTNVSSNANNISQPTETQSQGLQVQAQAQTQVQPHAQSSTASIVPTARTPTAGTNVGTGTGSLGGANPAVPRPMHAQHPVHPAAYYPYYPPPGMYQPYHWYGFLPGQPQPHMQPHMQQQHQAQVQAQQQQHPSQVLAHAQAQAQVQGQVPIQGVQVVQQQQQQGIPVPVDVTAVADSSSDASADGME